MTRRTTDETRDLLIEVALRMLHERRVYIGVTHVRLSDVAEAGGLTTGAAYRCWANQDEFHRDLATTAIRRRNGMILDRTVTAIRDLVDRGAPITEVIRAAANANIYNYPEDTAFLTTLALRTGAPADSAVAEACDAYLAMAGDSFTSLYGALLEIYGLRVRAPLTLMQLFLTLAALSEGFAIQTPTCEHPSIERAAVAPGVGTEWSLLACAVEAIVDRFTEPDPDARPRANGAVRGDQAGTATPPPAVSDDPGVAAGGRA